MGKLLMMLSLQMRQQQLLAVLWVARVQTSLLPLLLQTPQQQQQQGSRVQAYLLLLLQQQPQQRSRVRRVGMQQSL
jgi:hypothetical protein